jgi:hypothetical protein
MQTLITEEARNSCELWLPAGSRNDRGQLVTLYTDDLFYSDPSLRSGVTGRSVFNPRLEQARCSTRAGSGPAKPPPDHFRNKWRASATGGRDTLIRHGIRGNVTARERAGQTAPNSPIC